MKYRVNYGEHDTKKYVKKFKKDSLTQQQFKGECDVNNILAKHRRTGMLTHINKHQGNFGDFSNVGEYQENLHKLMQAQQSFDMLPSEIRSRFFNDPAKLIDFINDSNNYDEAVTLGLIPEGKKNKTKVQAVHEPKGITQPEGGVDGTTNTGQSQPNKTSSASDS